VIFTAKGAPALDLTDLSWELSYHLHPGFAARQVGGRRHGRTRGYCTPYHKIPDSAPIHITAALARRQPMRDQHHTADSPRAATTISPYSTHQHQRRTSHAHRTAGFGRSLSSKYKLTWVAYSLLQIRCYVGPSRPSPQGAPKWIQKIPDSYINTMWNTNCALSEA
jgi:hypothetical protein